MDLGQHLGNPGYEAEVKASTHLSYPARVLSWPREALFNRNVNIPDFEMRNPCPSSGYFLFATGVRLSILDNLYESLHFPAENRICVDPVYKSRHERAHRGRVAAERRGYIRQAVTQSSD